MGKRSTWIAIAVAALLIAGIAFAVSRLYGSGGQSPASAKVGEQWSVLRAVPSDAVAVMVFDGSKAARRVIADSTGILKTVIAQDSPALMGYLDAVGRHSTAVSLLSGGALVPLVVTLTDKADSASVAQMAQAAEKAGLKAQVKENFLIASRSETFVGSSARHIQEGSSILDVRNLDQLAATVKGPAVMFVNHSHAGKLLQVYSTPQFRKQSAFAKDLTAWSAWSVAELEKDAIVLEGTTLPGEAAASWLAAFKGTPAQAAEFPEALPYFAGTAVSIPVTDSYIQSRRSFEDGRGKLPRFEKALKDRAKRELTPAEWLGSLQAKEIVLVSFLADDVVRQAILLRSGRDLKLGKETPNPYRGCIGLLFGEYFSIADTVCSSLNSRWSIFGDLAAVKGFDKGDYSLKERMADASVPAPLGVTVYASLTDAPESVTSVLGGALGQAVKDWVTGSGYAPAVATLDLSGANPAFRIGLYKRALKGSKVQVMERDTTVVIPTGLFPVKNFSTGQTNYLYQNSHLSICLNDENGKGVWGVPFKEPICGRVQNIDYFGNGKIQFLFAAGTKLYAIDRLGHWVNGFPAELGKPVLLGPDVYDFTGAGGYTAMVLHKDNTLERYNLHGSKPEGWQGIKAPETVKNLPELVQVGDKRYWAVRTSVRTLIFPFVGGEPLVSGEGTKMIKPDARLELTSKGVKAECYDGKVRDFKLN